MGFIFGFDVDNHAINTVPKEVLVKITKAEDGGLGGVGIWSDATTGKSPGAEGRSMQDYLSGRFINVRGRSS
jgi:nitrate reductase alpha subunit